MPVEVHRAATAIEAEAIAAFLVENGIECDVEQREGSALGPVERMHEGWGLIRVDDADADRARALIAEFEKSPTVLPDASSSEDIARAEEAIAAAPRREALGSRILWPALIALALLLAGALVVAHVGGHAPRTVQMPPRRELLPRSR